MTSQSSSSYLIVLKLGGHALDNEEALQGVVEDISKLLAQNMRIVIIHGGGPHINDLMKRLKLESHFLNGLRITDEATLKVAEMALCATVNKYLVRLFLKSGLKAAGISGQDGNLLKAEILNPDLGKVGKIIAVNPELLQLLLSGGFLPVVAPIALDSDYEPLNINADTAAGAIAGALRADYFILVTDVPGILDGRGKLIAKIDKREIKTLTNDKIITGGMLPKTECCLNALAAGCSNAIILDGRQKNSLYKFINNKEETGTLISA